MNMTKVYEGKAKIIYDIGDDDRYAVYYKDDATAGNGAKKASITGKGELNCAICNIIYGYLEENGVKTHMVREADDRTIVVKRVRIFPLEVIVRNVAAGSFSKRFGVPEGSPLENPILEFCYKNDELGDPMINDDQITALKLASKAELAEIGRLAFVVNDLLSALFGKISLRLVDFKLEFGKDGGGNILLADEITPDTCRLWDKDTNAKLDKDVFRRDLGDLTPVYREVLRRLKELRS